MKPENIVIQSRINPQGAELIDKNDGLLYNIENGPDMGYLSCTKM